MKTKYIIFVIALSGMMNLLLAQSPGKSSFQGATKDTIHKVTYSGQQINVVLPVNGGINIDAASPFQPFCGYSIAGVSKAYTIFNGSTNQFEYHQSSDLVSDFLINGSSKAVFNTSFLGLGTSSPTTPFTGFSMKNNVNSWYGMYIDAGVTGSPFYGYALNGVAKAYTQFNGNSNQYEYYHSNPAIPDFLIGSTTASFPATTFLGIGTTNPTTGFTGLAVKNNTNNFWGMYIDAGTTGFPFYGYALNGTAVAYTGYNSTAGQFEYHHTSDATPDFLISSNKVAFPSTNFLGIGTTSPTTGFTGLAVKNNTSNFWGMYIDAGATGYPFYGYALNGIARAYTQFNSALSQLEYHQSSDVTPDFFINGTSKAVFNTDFLGIGTSNPTTGFTGFAVKKNTNNFWGMYIDAGATGLPFYGYALNGTAVAYTGFNSTAGQFEYHHTSDATPDFLISSTNAAFPSTTFLGIGTTSPTTGYTGLAVKNNTNNFWGMYIDAGATGQPFYGYALSGIAKAYTQFNSALGQLEYHQTSDATPDFYINGNTKAVFNTSFVGIGTGSPTTGADAFTMKSAVNDYYGMYIDAGASGLPFYGYALAGSAKAWTTLNGGNSNWELNYNGPRISVTPGGNVGLGTTIPSQRLDVNGTIHATNLNGGATSLSTDASGNIIRTPSDARLKCQITSIEKPLEKVMQLHGVSYKFKDTQRFGDSRQLGFLAQDLEQVVPETVSSGGEYKSVNYQEITALLTEAMKEQQKLIEKLQERIEMLEREKK